MIFIIFMTNKLTIYFIKDNEISKCGGVHLLGGYAIQAGGENTKLFEGLPAHNKIRIVANYHFIDAWSGETGFMRVSIGPQESLSYIWTEK